MKDLEQSTLQKFANLYWTRVISLHDFIPDLQESFKLGSDVAEELDKMYRANIENVPELLTTFDP